LGVKKKKNGLVAGTRERGASSVPQKKKENSKNFFTGESKTEPKAFLQNKTPETKKKKKTWEGEGKKKKGIGFASGGKKGDGETKTRRRRVLSRKERDNVGDEKEHWESAGRFREGKRRRLRGERRICETETRSIGGPDQHQGNQNERPEKNWGERGKRQGLKTGKGDKSDSRKVLNVGSVGIGREKKKMRNIWTERRGPKGKGGAKITNSPSTRPFH